MSLAPVSGGFRRRASASGSSRSRLYAVARAEGLEQRTLLATFVVIDAGDSGPGTLRQAILDANALTGPDTITFNVPGTDAVDTIRPLSALPEITGPTTVDGRAGGGITELDGSLAGPGANGLTVSGSQSVVRGLVINRFAGHGVSLGPTVVPPGRPGPVPTGIRLEGNFIGTDSTGNVALGNGGAGVMNMASATIIGAQSASSATAARNVVSGNAGPGVWITNAPGLPGQTGGAGIYGNYIGTSVGGGRALGNGREGLLIETGINTTVGGTVPASRNVISGNAASGIRVAMTTGSLLIQNNYVGTNAGGTGALPNGWSAALPYRDGITVSASVGSVRIGGPQPTIFQTAVRNVVSGNGGAGISVEAGTDVQVIGNFVGTDATGFSAVGNGGDGIAATAADTAVPTSARITGNLVSANGGDGVRVSGSARVVALGGNFIGTNAAGTGALGNHGNGVNLAGNTVPTAVGAPGVAPVPLPGNVIYPGGATRNIISANGGHGVLITAPAGPRTSAAPRVVQNNYIGTDYSGTLALGNGGSGIYIASGNVTVGGAGAGPSVGNLVSANGGNGITVFAPASAKFDTTSSNNRIEGNRIGTAAASLRDPPTQPNPGDDVGLGNRGNGVAVFNINGTRIGNGSVSGANVIAYNDGNGVLVEGPSLAPGTTPVASATTLVTANSIYGNRRLGIDLSPIAEGVTPNDPRDADSGPNGLQNHPIITEAVLNATNSSVQVRYMLLSEPGKNYRVEFFASPLPDAAGYGEGRTYLGSASASGDANGTAAGAFTAPLPPGSGLYFTATAAQVNTNVTSEFSPAVRGTPPADPPRPQDLAAVVDRRVFYNNSAFDGEDHARDLAAVAPDKQALLPGETASFKNVTSYDKGINGIVLTLFSSTLGRPALTADDFEFKVGSGAAGAEWVAGPAPDAVAMVPVPGPNSVYTLTWPNGAVRNTWLRVTVKANATTGLAAPDVFYFGNLVAETGDASTPTRVSAADMGGTKAHFNTEASIGSRYDFNRDGTINASDLVAVRSNYGRSLAPLAVPVPVANPNGTRSEPVDPGAEPITAQVLG